MWTSGAHCAGVDVARRRGDGEVRGWEDGSEGGEMSTATTIVLSALAAGPGDVIFVFRIWTPRPCSPLGRRRQQRPLLHRGQRRGERVQKQSVVIVQGEEHPGESRETISREYRQSPARRFGRRRRWAILGDNDRRPERRPRRSDHGRDNIGQCMYSRLRACAFLSSPAGLTAIAVISSH